MRYFSTRNRNKSYSFKEAVVKGLADDGGLFMPEKYPDLKDSLIANISDLNINEIAYEALSHFTDEDIPADVFNNLVNTSFNFPAPLVKIDQNNFVLELFHGPTLAFKDFGARFLARVMSYFVADSNTELNILAATSGDTGSAVASGFYGVEGINVFILYPSGKVSSLQEKQLTTFGKNITALEIDGTFDDCQKLVKQAFSDVQLNSKINLSSANSINIARLLPQMVYYFEAYKQLNDINKPIYFSVPSGNLGNLTAGLFASKSGLPVDKFIAATNNNSVFTEYVDTGKFEARNSIPTISNAMDVGNPSNLERIKCLFSNDSKLLRDVIFSKSFTDTETISKIGQLFNESDYLIDPHGAVGLMALEGFIKQIKCNEYKGIVLETAHPAKFKNVFEESLKINFDMPARLSEVQSKKKHSVKLDNDYLKLKEFLLSS